MTFSRLLEEIVTTLLHHHENSRKQTALQHNQGIIPPVTAEICGRIGDNKAPDLEGIPLRAVKVWLFYPHLRSTPKRKYILFPAEKTNVGSYIQQARPSIISPDLPLIQDEGEDHLQYTAPMWWFPACPLYGGYNKHSRESWKRRRGLWNCWARIGSQKRIQLRQLKPN